MADPAAVPARPITHRRVLAVAVPIVISNATVPILGAVDTGVIGQLGQAAAIGAVGIGAIILTAFYWIFGFLRMGTVGLTSQALGAGNQAEADALLSRALMIGLAAGAVFIIGQVPMFWLGFKVSPASDEVEGMAALTWRSASGRPRQPSPSSASTAGSSQPRGHAACCCCSCG